MKIRWFFVVFVAAVSAGGRPAGAEEPVVAFVNGLRQRGYYDTAEEYLDTLVDDPGISADVKKVIPYHRALVLTDAAYNKRNGDEQQRFFDLAATFLDKFVKSNPGHPLLGDAETRRGKIYLGKAGAYILQAHSPSNSGRRAELQKLALENIQTARTIFKVAHDAHEKRWRSFPVNTDDKALRARRERALTDFMLAQLDLAQTTYQEAQAYDRKHPKFAELLTKASKEFDAIHTHYRSQIGGLLARMWQGKCFEEQDQIGRALGIYNELLEHPSRKDSFLKLRRQVLHFKLICQNRRNEHLLVEQDAQEWLKRNRAIQRTMTGLGIRYQLAIARENFAAKKGLPETKKKEYLRLAQSDAEFVNRFPGKYKVVTTLMIARIKKARGIDTNDPENFSDAVSVARLALRTFAEKRTAVNAAKSSGGTAAKIAALKGELKDALEEGVRLHQLALTLAKPASNLEHVLKTREVLAYLYYQESLLLGRNDRLLDAAVLAEFVARHGKDVSPKSAANAANIALACYGRIYNLAPRGRRDAEIRWVIDIARYASETWPGSKVAINAANNLGKMFEQRRQHLIAARWYSRIPATAKGEYAVARIRAGQQYWAHYLASTAKQPGRETWLREMRNNVGRRWADAVADLLNPSWEKQLRLQRRQQVRASIQAIPDDGDTAKKPRAAVHDDGPTVREDSLRELKSAMAELTNRPPETFDNRKPGDLRKRLLQMLRRRSTSELQQLFERRLKAMDDASLKRHYQEKIEQWRMLAAWNLQDGVTRLQREVPDKSPTPEDLTAGKVTLSQYILSEGGSRPVVALLTHSPHSVLEAIKVDWL
ncbi:MAG: hypothetical protein ACE5KM_21770, partial [Planctomycetaceae bacterium]